MAHQGLDQYLPEEFQRVHQEVEAIRSRLPAAPEEAQAASLRLAADLTRLPALAREAKQEFESAWQERFQSLAEQRRDAQTTIDSFINSQLMSLTDPVVRDFAYEEIRALQQSYVGRSVGFDDFEAEKQRIQERLDSIRAAAQEKATAWKARKEEEVQAEAQQALLEFHRGEVAANVAKDPEGLRNVLSDLDVLQQHLEQALPVDTSEVQEAIERAVDRADEAALDERCRKETVRAVLESLKKAGFTVSKPRRQKTEDRDEVVVLARKPAGHQAEFRVTLAGALFYKFDQYEGMSCKNDIDQVLPLLQDIYGVELSDERVLWQNPIRDSRTARPLAPVAEGQQHAG